MQMMQEEITTEGFGNENVGFDNGNAGMAAFTGDLAMINKRVVRTNCLRRSFNKAAANVARTCNHSNNINRNRFGKIQNCERECR